MQIASRSEKITFCVSQPEFDFLKGLIVEASIPGDKNVFHQISEEGRGFITLVQNLVHPVPVASGHPFGKPNYVAITVSEYTEGDSISFSMKYVYPTNWPKPLLEGLFNQPPTVLEDLQRKMAEMYESMTRQTTIMAQMQVHQPPAFMQNGGVQPGMHQHFHPNPMSQQGIDPRMFERPVTAGYTPRRPPGDSSVVPTDVPELQLYFKLVTKPFGEPAPDA